MPAIATRCSFVKMTTCSQTAYSQARDGMTAMTAIPPPSERRCSRYDCHEMRYPVEQTTVPTTRSYSHSPGIRSPCAPTSVHQSSSGSPLSTQRRVFSTSVSIIAHPGFSSSDTTRTSSPRTPNALQPMTLPTQPSEHTRTAASSLVLAVVSTNMRRPSSLSVSTCHRQQLVGSLASFPSLLTPAIPSSRFFVLLLLVFVKIKWLDVYKHLVPFGLFPDRDEGG